MNLWKLTDGQLADLRQSVVNECGRRTRLAMDGIDAGAVVYGNELAKRALVVAAAGKHSLLLLGPKNSGKTMLRAVAAALSLEETFEARSCPCGEYGVLHGGVCGCTAAQIGRHRRKIPAAEINVEVCRPQQREVNGQFRGSSLADLQRQIAASLPRDKVAAALSASAHSLLRAAALDGGFDLVTEAAVREVARTIAALDRKIEIGASHICEAINYRSLEGLAVTSQPRRVRGPAGKQAA
jgi:hypothetical protein